MLFQLSTELVWLAKKKNIAQSPSVHHLYPEAWASNANGSSRHSARPVAGSKGAGPVRKGLPPPQRR